MFFLSQHCISFVKFHQISNEFCSSNRYHWTVVIRLDSLYKLVSAAENSRNSWLFLSLNFGESSQFVNSRHRENLFSLQTAIPQRRTHERGYFYFETSLDPRIQVIFYTGLKENAGLKDRLRGENPQFISRGVQYVRIMLYSCQKFLTVGPFR